MNYHGTKCLAPGIPVTFQSIVAIRGICGTSFVAVVNHISYVVREGLCCICGRCRPDLLISYHSSQVIGEGVGCGCGFSCTVVWSA